MSEDSFLPERKFSPEVEHTLLALAERQMLSPARRAGYELRLVGATVLPQRQTIERTKWGTWLFVNHAEDPTSEEYGGRIPIPPDQLARLRELDRIGVTPKHAWIGHQLPDTYEDGAPLPRLVPDPPSLREKDERLTLGLASATSLYFKAITGFLAGAGTAPLLALGAAAGAGLDPIVFGGVQHPDLPVVEWCVLAQWEWE